MLSKYFQERFEDMPRPEDLSAEEARQLVIDAYRLLINNRLAVAGVGVQLEVTTIEDELENLIIPDDFRNAIYVIHIPPANIGLDVCYDGRKVGSIAVYNFLLKHQPLLTLHGHIHESPKISNKWFAYLNKTLCIQPGQSNFNEDYLKFVVIDLETLNFENFQIRK